MPAAVLFVLLSGLSLVSCEEQADEEFICLDTESEKLLIVPENPSSEDQILAIETICGNESDVILDIQGRHISYKRYVNSLMMMPCSPRLDTTSIGQLRAGQYQLVHCVIDKNHLLTDSIVLLDTICLNVE
jgi:hypothetical protein